MPNFWPFITMLPRPGDHAMQTTPVMPIIPHPTQGGNLVWRCPFCDGFNAPFLPPCPCQMVRTL